MFGGIGSAAISAVPVRAKMRSISGNRALRAASSCCCISTDCVRLVPGMRSAWMAKSPSSSWGTNSLPSRDAKASDTPTSTAAKVITTGVLASDAFNAGS